MSRQQPRMNNLEILDTQQTIEGLTVAKLKDVARSIGLALSGRKADIQERIKAFFGNGVRSSDYVRLLTVRTLVLKAATDQQLPNYQMLYTSIQNNSYQFDVPNQYSNASAVLSGPVSKSHHEGARPWLYFKESAFYRLKRLVHGTPVLAQRAPETRGSCSISFVLNESEAGLLSSGKHYHLLLLAGVYDGVPSQEAFVEFPQPLEIHFNGNLVKDSVKGIKNRPGTARPADLTEYLKFAPSVNKLDLVYAFAKTDYLVFCYIVEMISAEQVLQKIIGQPHIAKLATMKELQKEQNEEDDLVEMQEVITLRCPLTYGRMKYPAKSLYCKHSQCFDALSFLQLQEQASTWSCPICQKSVTVKTLAIDDYLDEVIKNTSEADEAIEIQEDGSWKVKSEDEITGNNQGETTNYTKASQTSPAFSAKRENSTPAIPRETSNPAEAIEIISLDSDSDVDEEEEAGEVANNSPSIEQYDEVGPAPVTPDEEEDEDEGMNSLFEEIEREVQAVIPNSPSEPNKEGAENSPDDPKVGSKSVVAAAPSNGNSAPLPPPLDPPPFNAISATSPMIDEQQRRALAVLTTLNRDKTNSSSATLTQGQIASTAQPESILRSFISAANSRNTAEATILPNTQPTLNSSVSPHSAAAAFSPPLSQPIPTQNGAPIVPAAASSNPRVSSNVAALPMNGPQTHAEVTQTRTAPEQPNHARHASAPSLSNSLPSWNQQTLLRPVVEACESNGNTYSPSRFRPHQTAQSLSQLDTPSHFNPNSGGVMRSNSLGQQAPPNTMLNGYQHGYSQTPQTKDRPVFSQPKRVNLGFSLSADILPSLARPPEPQGSESSTFLASTPSTHHPSFNLDDSSLLSNFNPPFNMHAHQSPIETRASVPSVNLHRSPSRFVPVGESHERQQQPSLTQQKQMPFPMGQNFHSSTPSKRSLDVVDLVSSDDEDTPLAKR